MSEICPKCGLPQDICVCESIAKEDQQIIISRVKRKFGKIATIIGGIKSKNINLKEVAKSLKGKLACGGTVKENSIELQGNHAEKVKEELIKLGFNSDSIIIKEDVRYKR
ncbi:MAG TPA: translation initiation factor [Candidatus Nanoarchaeia archaeon]|nr:translation initiation factor [Candidatus Nanoarchaeia archaeon]